MRLLYISHKVPFYLSIATLFLIIVTLYLANCNYLFHSAEVEMGFHKTQKCVLQLNSGIPQTISWEVLTFTCALQGNERTAGTTGINNDWPPLHWLCSFISCTLSFPSLILLPQKLPNICTPAEDRGISLEHISPALRALGTQQESNAALRLPTHPSWQQCVLMSYFLSSSLSVSSTFVLY